MTVPGLLQYAGDFRSEAVEASRVLLAPVAGDVDAVAVSTCTHVEDEVNLRACLRARRQMMVTSIAGIVVVTAGVIAGALGRIHNQQTLLLVAIFVSLFGLGLMLWQIWSRNAAVRRMAIARGVEVEPSVRCVTIENAMTYSSMKFVPEDVALVWIDPGRHCVRLEGMSHRYIIYAADVVNLAVRRGPAQTSTSVTYRMGSAQLALTLAESQGNLLEIFMQTFGLAQRMHPTLIAALTAPAGEEVLDAIAE
jgi:hypothetical protein